MSKQRRYGNPTESRMVNALDKLAAFDDYCDDLLPILQTAINEGWSAEKIEKHPKIQALLVARQLTIALRDQDTSRALAAIKDARDRTGGKSIERKEIKHSLSDAPDEQLDSKLASLLKGTESDDSDELPN